MPTPIKPIDVATGAHTKEDIQARRQAEQKLKGQSNKIEPPSYLSRNQKKIFRFIVSELEASDILNNLDNYVLVQASIAIDMLQQIDTQINNDPNYLNDPDKIRSLSVLRTKYFNEFKACVPELCLSPQARAKLALTNAQKMAQEEDPLLKALRDDDDD